MANRLNFPGIHIHLAQIPARALYKRSMTNRHPLGRGRG